MIDKCNECNYYLYYKVFRSFVLKDLSIIQREIAKLRYEYELNYRQIGTKVGRSISTVHFHLNKINKSLDKLNELMELSKLIKEQQ